MQLRRPNLRDVRAAVLACLVLSLGACPKLDPDDESDGGSGAGGTSSSAPGNDSETALDELSHSDLQSYCQDLNQELSTRFDNRRLVTYDCLRKYIQGSDSQTCQLQVNDCLLNNPQVSPGAPRPPEFALDNAECDGIGECRLSVREFDACIGDRFAQSDQLMRQLTCSLANDPQALSDLLQKIDSPRPLPQSCAGVARVCPELL
jgi:hypothetical protein